MPFCAAVPKHIEIIQEIPKTAVGKVFKPDLRRSAIMRVYNAALEDAELDARVEKVVEDKKLGLVAQLNGKSTSDHEAVKNVLGAFTLPWVWLEDA